MVRVLSILALSVGLGPSLLAQDLVITNAQIVDPATQTIDGGSLWIRDGRIVASAGEIPPQVEQIDAHGRWVIPGLVDMHTHSFGNAAPGGISDGMGTEGTALRVLRAGVTAFLDLFSVEDYIFGLRDRQRSGAVDGAEIFASGPCMTATNGHCSEYGIETRLINTPDEARQQVAALAPKNPDVVKVVYDHFDYGPRTLPTIDRATLEALIAAAGEHRFKTVVHVGTWQDVRDAANAGAAAVTHVPRDGVVPDDIGPLLVSRGVYHIPTLVVHSELSAFFDDPVLADVPLLAALTTDAVRDVYRSGLDGLDERAQGWIAMQRRAKRDVVESVRRLHRAGVTMLAGTDAGNWGVIQGYSIHRELIRLVEAGLTPWEALAAATTTAGEFLDRRFGVQAGDAANLVVLDASPIDAIENTQQIHMVILRGEVVHGR